MRPGCPLTQPVLSGYPRDPVWLGFQATHELLAAWVSQTELAVLPLATHLLQLVNPRGAAAALAGFLARHPLRGAA